MSRRKFLARGAFGVLGTFLAGYPFFIERYLFQVNTYTIPLANLPLEFNGFTIVHLTDLHYGLLMPLSAIRYIVRKANALPKDLIVCTGDYVHERNSTRQIDTVWPELSQLSAEHGVYSVLGNHDHWSNFQRSLYWLKRSGQNIRHRAVQINKGASRIWIGGAGDYWEDELGIDRAFQNVPPLDCKILLAHNPDTADTGFQTEIDLMISGHTHGGQVVIPFRGPPILPVSNKRYASGFIKTNRTHLFISKGLGWAIIPVRLNCLPEIAVLKLERAKRIAQRA